MILYSSCYVPTSQSPFPLSLHKDHLGNPLVNVDKRVKYSQLRTHLTNLIFLLGLF